MTRSDIVLAKAHAKTIQEKDELINRLHYKIEQAYEFVYVMETNKYFKEIGRELRKALEA